MGQESPDPQDSGMRGVIYYQNKNLKLDMQEASQGGDIFISTNSVKVVGDKIYILENPPLSFLTTEFGCYVYEKSDRKISDD